jgi:hypothetical protein
MTQKESRPGIEGAASVNQGATKFTRRRAASQRLPVLDCRRSDPWWHEPPTAGYEDAAAHLLERGLTPAPDRDGLRRMWRSGNSRRMAGLIAQRWELVST